MTTLISLLCAENWWWDSGEESYIRFHEDGTGEVSLSCHLSPVWADCIPSWLPVANFAFSSRLISTGNHTGRVLWAMKSILRLPGCLARAQSVKSTLRWHLQPVAFNLAIWTWDDLGSTKSVLPIKHFSLVNWLSDWRKASSWPPKTIQLSVSFHPIKPSSIVFPATLHHFHHDPCGKSPQERQTRYDSGNGISSSPMNDRFNGKPLREERFSMHAEGR